MEKYLAPLNEIFEKYTKDEKYLIPILQDAQDEYGYLPEEVLKEIACKLDLSLSQVFGVVTFYSQFHLEPRGENIIRVCTGTACHVRGGAEVLDQLKQELNIDSGETTEDLEFTLETVACIGACGLAPVIMINDDTYGRMNSQKVPEVLADYQ
jgi:NADH-quinone oxidoreductase subunit E/NADP-reducing hydrogenase subunit HndA